jgi:predicted transcriptional regulator of viral defense system
MERSTKKAARTLFARALEQGGYFTAKQAQEAGYGYPHLEYHVASGNFERVSHGLYRIPDLPAGENDQFIRLSFWSRNRHDEPQAVVSHESALALHDLTELLPGEVHLTVPPKFRKPAPDGCVLHKANLSPQDAEEREGFRVTTPLRSIIDVAAGTISQEQLDKAVSEAIRRGLVRRARLIEAVRADRRLDRLRRILEAEPVPVT